MKRCTGCLEVKDLAGFYPRRQSPDGLEWRCIKCKKAYAKDTRAKNRAWLADPTLIFSGWSEHRQERSSKGTRLDRP